MFQKPKPAANAYPGFFAPVAAAVKKMDGCFGEFVQYLKSNGMYDDSIVILTSDHGDSLGDRGQWGHAYTIFPEVMRVPLIVHLPEWLRSKVETDLSRVALSADITPTLYELLGYQPADLGSLYGSPLFVARGGRLSDRRRGPVLLASSYGSVYGMLRHNGRFLYIANAIEGRDYAYDLSSNEIGERVQVTAAMRTLNWRLIREEVAKLAAQYHFTPPQ
jgi:arylsulfatase A-like enzyme